MNTTITRLAFSALAGRRRFWLLLGFPAALVAIAVLVRVLTGDGEPAWTTLMTIGVTLVLPLVALLAASSVMGPEVDDGSLVYLLAKPVSRHAVANSKFLVAVGATILVGTLPLLLTGLAVHTDEMRLTFATWVGTVVSGVTYTAFFLALSTVLRHAVVTGLIFVLIWEGTLGNVLSGVAWLSIAQWGNRVSVAIEHQVGGPDITLWWAILASVVVTLGSVWFAGDRLRSFSPRGED